MKHLLLITLLLSGVALMAQQTIQSKVLDKSTNEPIAFAHVVCGDISTITNSDGEFVITPSSPDRLNISYVGYQIYSTKTTGDIPKIIYLDPSSTDLDAATTTTNGESIMREFWNRRIINYDLEALRTTSYYKEKLIKSNTLTYLAEGIMDILKPANVNQEGVKIVPIKSRKMIEPNFVLDPVYIQGNAFDMVVSSIWRENSFLSKSEMKHYEFTNKGKLAYGDKNVYLVTFEPRTGKGYVSGTLYINDSDYAIVKMEYTPDSSLSDFWESVRWEEEFEMHKGSYVLSSVRYYGTYMDLKEHCEFEAVLLNNKISDENIDTFPATLLDEKDVFLKKASSDFSDSFWEQYNFLRLTKEELSSEAQLSK